MTIKLERKHLQENKYDYVWQRDNGDSAYKGAKDRVRVDKDEGYEVLYFIESFMNKHGLEYTRTSSMVEDVHKIENALKSPKLSSITMRNKLIEEIESFFNL